MGIKIKNVHRESALRTFHVPFGPNTSASCVSGAPNFYVMCPVQSKFKGISYFIENGGTAVTGDAADLLHVTVTNQGRNSAAMDYTVTGTTAVVNTILDRTVYTVSNTANVIVSAGSPFYINVSACEVAGHVQGVLIFEVERSAGVGYPA